MAEILQCWNETLAGFAVSVWSGDLHRLSGMDGDEMLATLGPASTNRHERKSWPRKASAIARSTCRGCGHFPACAFVFSAIKSRGGRIALATDCQTDELKRYCSLLNVDDLIDAIACGDEVATGKPDPAVVELALDHLGSTPAAFATMIGDTPFDAQAARSAGVTAWGTLSGGHTRSSLVVRSVEDFGRYFAREKPQVSPVPAHQH